MLIIHISTVDQNDLQTKEIKLLGQNIEKYEKQQLLEQLLIDDEHIFTCSADRQEQV